VLADVRRAEVEASAADVRRSSGEQAAMAVVADLAKPEDCAAVVDAAVDAYGRLDILFNNAGVGTQVVGGTVETITLEQWDLAHDVNVRAMYLTSRAAIPHLRAAGGGSIVNVSSVSAFQASRTRPTHAYAASKGAVLSLTRAMAVAYGRDRIRVNAICPGLIRRA
jgi:NAD(P)-dependent dehydrogenase (short-subunit alcohol dehydrogenase family)